LDNETCKANLNNVLRARESSVLYSPELVQFDREGVCLLIDPAAPNWISTNSAGSIVIRNCDGRRTLKEISVNLQNTCGFKKSDITRFINRMVEAGLIQTNPDLAPSYTKRSDYIFPSVLEELWINTNNSCPLHCIHCLVDSGRENATIMTTAEIQKLIDEAISIGVRRIYFTGGEPFLRKDIFSLIEYVTKRIQLVILTSGVLISPENAARLKGISNDNLVMQVSLEGPDAATNDAIRGEGSFGLAVEGIKRLIEIGLTPIVTTTLTGLNYRNCVETTHFLASLGIKDQHVLWLHGRGRMRVNVPDLILSGDVVAQVMSEMKQAAKDSGILFDNAESLALRVQGKAGRKNDLCNACYGMLSVDTDSHVYPCAALTGAASFDCGSLKDKSLREIWIESKVSKWIRENSVQKRVGCSSCFLKFFCGGGCFAQSYLNYEMTTGKGCIMAMDPYCEAYRSQIMETMWEYAMPEKSEKIENIPMLYRAMGNELPGCAVGGNEVLNAAYDVGTHHCSCVLATDIK